MNLEIRRAERGTLVAGPGPEGGGPDHVQDTGDPGADHGDGQTPEAGGALKAPAGSTLNPETEAGDLQADREIERKKIQGGEDPERPLKATVQPGGHAARTGDAEEVEATADLLKSLPKEEPPGLHLLEDTRRKRKGIRKGTGTARVIKIAVARNVNAPPAGKRKVKTKKENERENQMARKEM